MAISEDEIYSIMFTSLKHPVRRRILRMLGEKQMTFMELVEQLDVSSSHLTYHLESLGELVVKMDNGVYKLSSFGLATVGTMKGVEEVSPVEPKRRLLSFRWKAIIGALLIAVILLAGVSAVQVLSINRLSKNQAALSSENQQLISWGYGSQGYGNNKVADFIQNVAQLAVTNYTIAQTSDTTQWRTDFGGVSEEDMEYSLTSTTSNLNLEFRFRDNHFSRYALTTIESNPIFSQPQPTDIIQNANETLMRYQAFSGDSYLTNMTELLAAFNPANLTAGSDTSIIQGNMKLEVTDTDGTVTFFWMYTQDGIDFQTKGLEMIFQYGILITMTDGYYLFTIANTNLNVDEQQAISLAENYVKTLTWTIQGQQVSGFKAVEPPISIQMVPHVRGDSVALVPYWYIEMSLTQIYPGGYNEVTVGIYADTGQVVDVQVLSSDSATT